jgi:hypothetical protein
MLTFEDVDILGLGDEGGFWDNLFTGDEEAETDAYNYQADLAAQTAATQIQTDAATAAAQQQTTIIIVAIVSGVIFLIAGLYFIFK